MAFLAENINLYQNNSMVLIGEFDIEQAACFPRIGCILIGKVVAGYVNAGDQMPISIDNQQIVVNVRSVEHIDNLQDNIFKTGLVLYDHPSLHEGSISLVAKGICAVFSNHTL